MNEQPQIQASHTSRWSHVALVLVILGGLSLIVLGIDYYWGADGVRLVSVVAGIALVILFIIGLGVSVMFVASRMAMDHHDNVLRGLVAFQNADDRGEVARTVANGISGAMRSGNSLDRTVLQLAGRMAQGQISATNDAQRQLTDQERGAPTWANRADVDATADFRVVE